MKPRLRVFSIAVVAAIIVFLVVWKAMIAARGSSASSHLQEEVHSALTSPANFVKSRVTGGVGVMLAMDNATGLPIVHNVLPGSSAQSAGLLAGDIITKVNDKPTAGQTLTQVVEAIRGFTGGRVMVTVQRAGSTNLTLVIQRSSWNSLGLTNSFQTPVP